MMREETARNIDALRTKVGDGIFRGKDAKGYVSISTLRKYKLITSATERQEVSIDDLINTINELIDGYTEMTGWCEREGDKIYFCDDYDRYKFI